MLLPQLSPLAFVFVAFAVSVLGGVVGSLLGLGGGIIVVPALTLLLDVPIHLAIGASIVAVIATSTGSAATYVRQHMTNLRLAMVLEIATVGGALTGALVSGLVKKRWLFIIFGLVLGYAALAMFRDRFRLQAKRFPPDPLADRLRLHGVYVGPAGAVLPYRISRTRTGLTLSYVAGVISGLLGVGGGIMKVPAMNLAMGVPLKAATATSNFMIGVTAATGAAIWFGRGDVDPFIAGPVAAGVLLGATIGSRLMRRLHTDLVRWLFLIVLVISMVQMIVKGWRLP